MSGKAQRAQHSQGSPTQAAPWASQRFSGGTAREEVAPELQDHEGYGNHAMILAMAELAVEREAGAGASTSETATPARQPTDAEQVAASRETADGALAEAQGMRARLDAKVAELERLAAPHIRCGSPAFHVLMRTLSPMLPADLSKEEVVAKMGLPTQAIGGVDSLGLRQGADPARPQLVAYSNEEGEAAMEEKMAGFRKARIWGEAKRAPARGLGALLGNSTDRSVKPAMTVLFDGSGGLDAGLEEANEALNGPATQQLTGGVATHEALKEAGSMKRLNKAATGEGLFGGIANRVFRKSMPEARARAAAQGAESRDQAGTYVAKEAKAQLLNARARVEAQMLENGIPLSTVSIGAVFDPSATRLSPNTLNLFIQTKSGARFHLQDIGGKVSFETGEAMEALVSELHADGQLTDEALRKVAARFGLEPTEEGGFAALER